MDFLATGVSDIGASVRGALVDKASPRIRQGRLWSAQPFGSARAGVLPVGFGRPQRVASLASRKSLEDETLSMGVCRRHSESWSDARSATERSPERVPADASNPSFAQEVKRSLSPRLSDRQSSEVLSTIHAVPAEYQDGQGQRTQPVPGIAPASRHQRTARCQFPAPFSRADRMRPPSPVLYRGTPEAPDRHITERSLPRPVLRRDSQ